MKWYSRNADQGIAEAQFNRDTMYFGDRGAPSNIVEAHKWFRLAVRAAQARSCA